MNVKLVWDAGPTELLPPAVIVHGLDMARHAVTTASASGAKLTLLSAPGAGAYAGVGWWRALVALACPDPGMADILDCGEAPGRALEALRVGQKRLVLHAEPRIWADVAARAAACHGLVLAQAPPALDLGQRGAERRLASWLQSGQPPTQPQK